MPLGLSDLIYKINTDFKMFVKNCMIQNIILEFRKFDSKIPEISTESWMYQGEGKFGWSENFNEQPLVNYIF